MPDVLTLAPIEVLVVELVVKLLSAVVAPTVPPKVITPEPDEMLRFVPVML